MSYPKIQKALGWSELPATASEGIFFQPVEVATLEAGLAASEELATANTALETANARIEELEAAAVVAAELATTNAATIAGLNTAISVLGGKSSGAGGSELPIDKEIEEKPKSDSKTYAWNDPDHPANQSAARRRIKVKP